MEESELSRQPGEFDVDNREGVGPLGWRMYICYGLLSVIILCAGISAARTKWFTDDAGFFFRYAEHLANGHGFRWNTSEPPIWGASAPLWAVVLAVPVAMGSSPEIAAVGMGCALTLAAGLALSLTALRLRGGIEALLVAMLMSANFKLCLWSTQGMEAPLGYALIAAGVIVVAFDTSLWIAGIVAGLALIHKVDFALFGVLILAGVWIRTRRCPLKAMLIAAALGGSWYAFAAWYFGSPLPNSMLTKWHVTYGQMPRHWFVLVGLFDGCRKFLTIFALLGLIPLRKRPALLVACSGLVVLLAGTYTLKPPPEPFEWYAMPIQPMLCFGAAIGAGWVLGHICRRVAPNVGSQRLLSLMAALALALTCLVEEKNIAAVTRHWINCVEQDRTLAGKWIDAHLASNATVLTGFGNVAYYSHRHVYDSSYLNRIPPVGESEDLIRSFRPDAIAYTHYATARKPEEILPPSGYRVSAVFENARSAGIDSFVTVMTRSNVPWE